MSGAFSCCSTRLKLESSSLRCDHETGPFFQYFLFEKDECWIICLILSFSTYMFLDICVGSSVLLSVLF